MEQPTPEEARENLIDFLKRLDPPLVLTTSPVSREVVPVWQRQVFSEMRGEFEAYTVSRGDRQIEGYCFKGSAAHDETAASDLISSLMVSAEHGETEEIIDLSNELLQILFTEEQIEVLYTTRY